MGESLYGTKIYYAVYKIPNAGKGTVQNFKKKYENLLNRRQMLFLGQFRLKISNNYEKFNLHAKSKVNTVKFSIYRNMTKSSLIFIYF